MDIQDQLKNLFPEHVVSDTEAVHSNVQDIWLQDEPLICKYEKRKGKPITIIEDYNGAKEDFKKLTQDLKKQFSVGGSYKDDKIIIQGNFRDQIMQYLKQRGFNVKRVGG